jgi:cell shape-determining protein MreC
MPYIVSVICAFISGFASYACANKKARNEIKKIEKQHKLDIEKEREKSELEKEKMEIEFKHQLELKEKEIENQMGANLMNAVFKEAMNSPEIKKQFQQGIKQGLSKNKKQT